MSITYPAARAAACRAVGLDPDVHAEQLTGNDPADLGASAADLVFEQWTKGWFPGPEPGEDLHAALATHAADAAVAAGHAEWLQFVTDAGLTDPSPASNQ